MNRIDKLIEAMKSKLDILDDFMNEGASEEEIRALELHIGLDLPESLRYLLKKYNGEKTYLGIMGCYNLLSVQEIKREWDFIVETTKQENFEKDYIYLAKSVYQSGYVHQTLYDKGRIPFAHDGSGEFLAIDYFPDTLGNKGQIVYLGLGEDYPISVLFKDFDEFIDFLIECLENGKFYLENDGKKYSQVHEEILENTNFSPIREKDDWTDIADAYNKSQGII